MTLLKARERRGGCKNFVRSLNWLLIVKIFQESKSKNPKIQAPSAWAHWQNSLLDFGVELAIILFLVFAVIRPYIIAPFKIQQNSMEPNAHHNEYVIVLKLPYNSVIGWRNYGRGDIIVFRPNNSPENFLIKRIIGLPGETVRLYDGAAWIRPAGGTEFTRLDDSYLYEGNQGNTCLTANSNVCPEAEKQQKVDFEVPAGHYFALGDNRLASRDARSCFGSCNAENDHYLSSAEIEGRAWVVVARKYGKQFYQVSLRAARFFGNPYAEEDDTAQ